MKRLHIFPVFLIFSVLFACQIPTAIEIRGTPEIRFSSKMDIGGMFVQQLEDGFDSPDFSLISCVNTANFTYIVHKDLFDEVLDMTYPPEGCEYDDDTHGDTELTEPINLINPSDSESIPLSGFGDFLDGFTFSNEKSFLYVSGDPVVKRLWLGITVNGGHEQEFKIKDSISSGLLGDEYFLTALPQDGHFIDLPLDGSDVSVEYRVFAKEGTEFAKGAFDGAYIRVELVIWLPLEFTADQDGAEITFPAMFFGEDDLFGRESPDAESAAMDIIESLSIIIKLDTNPFLGKYLVINNGENIEIREQIKTNSLNFVFDEENMVLINDPVNWPFAPTFKVAFDKGDTLKIPRVFNSTELIFLARIKIIIDLNDSSGETDNSGETGDL